MFTPINTTPEEGYRKKCKFTRDVINYDLFPHCKTKKQKIYFLGYMTNKLIRCSIGLNSPDDRDSYQNKRIDLVGALLNNLFRNYFNKLVPMDNNLYIHTTEGKDDMPAHIKSALTNNQISLSIKNKELILGAWQGLYLFEHRLEKQSRKIFHHFIGN